MYGDGCWGDETIGTGSTLMIDATGSVSVFKFMLILCHHSCRKVAELGVGCQLDGQAPFCHMPIVAEC
jgi:hypothetical protein